MQDVDMRPSKIAQSMRLLASSLETQNGKSRTAARRRLKRILVAIYEPTDMGDGGGFIGVENDPTPMFEVEDQKAVFQEFIDSMMDPGDFQVLSVERTGPDEAEATISWTQYDQPFTFEFSGEEGVKDVWNAFESVLPDPSSKAFEAVKAKMGDLGHKIRIEDRDLIRRMMGA